MMHKLGVTAIQKLIDWQSPAELFDPTLFGILFRILLDSDPNGSNRWIRFGFGSDQVGFVGSDSEFGVRIRIRSGPGWWRR